jgi:acyl carrier protein
MNSNTELPRSISAGDLAELVSFVVGHDIPVDVLVSCESVEDVGVTSLHMFRLIAAIEDRLGFALEDDEIEPVRFRNYAAISATIKHHGVSVVTQTATRPARADSHD